jgi:hypothetical protein
MESCNHCGSTESEKKECIDCNTFNCQEDCVEECSNCKQIVCNDCKLWSYGDENMYCVSCIKIDLLSLR